jgi:murein DD-endopeptidase MepM/ murein hydrolase activator NlpD
VIIAGSLFISFLVKEVNSLELKKKVAQEQYIASKIKINEEYKKLQINNKKLKDKIEFETKKYDEIKEKVNDIEELVGLKTNVQTVMSDRLENLKFTSKQEKVIFQNIPNGYIVPYIGIASKFGWRIHPILKRKEFHKGLDFRAKRNTPIKAPADGVVEFAGYHKRSGFGNLIIIDHNYGFKTSYGHLRKVAVKAGQFIKKGEIIGYTGSSGLSTGPHLHYEVRFVSRALNPIYFVKWNNSNFKQIFKKEKYVPWESLVNMINNRFQIQKQPSSPTEPK